MTEERAAGEGTAAYAAVVLTGGTGRRLGGVDKAALLVGGRSLLARALDACSDAVEIVAVGPRPASLDEPSGGPPLSWTREEPPGGGPAAGILAGLDAVSSHVDRVLVLAVDMPLVSRGTVRRLVTAAASVPGPGGGASCDGAVLLGPDGRRQLAAVLRVDALQAVRPHDPDGSPVHRLLASLSLTEVAATADESLDVDTESDLNTLRSRLHL